MPTKTQAAKIEAARRELSRRKLINFTSYTFSGEYDVNWHHEEIAEHLEALTRGDIRNLILTTPPRRGKSELVSRRLPAYIFGHDPEAQILAATHTQELSESMSRDVQRIMQTEAYTNLFGPRLGERRVRNKEFETNQGGSYRAVGVGMRIAGFGAKIGIIDDYLGSRADAESQTERDRIWEWYNDDFSTRLKYPSRQIIMATRWHHDDLIGRILNSADADRWHVLHFPEILDTDTPPDYDPRDLGEPLWPGYFSEGPHVDEDKELLVERAVEEFERRMERNAYGTEALFQGRPTPREGGLFKRDHFDSYSASPREAAEWCSDIFISVDASFKGSSTSDHVAMLVIGRRGANEFFLLDEVYAQLDYPSTKAQLRHLAGKWPRSTILIEGKANGPALIAELKREFRIIEFDPGKNTKETRAQLAANTVSSGGVFLPSSKHAPWIGAWIEDLTGFPSRPKDDRVDAFTQVLLRWDSQNGCRENLLRIVGESG